MTKNRATTARSKFDDHANETRFFARYPGPGAALMYPSPRPGLDVPDLCLPIMKWVQVDAAYGSSVAFVRDRRAGKFEWAEGSVSPADVVLEVDESLSPTEREMIRAICLTEGDTIPDQYLDAIRLADLIGSNGRPLKQGVSVTCTFLKEKHAPFLEALMASERRYQKRKGLLALIGRQVAKIERLPNDRPTS